ncbi:MAG TPA: hypothetical protein VFI10_05120 [Gaiellaceae bacterium]|nr:hypothetical protein [Gaiellaceae bacterium]
MNRAYRRTVLVSAAIAIALGFAILIRTAYEGGGTVGYAIGALFVALGTARLYLLTHQRGP